MILSSDWQARSEIWLVETDKSFENLIKTTLKILAESPISKTLKPSLRKIGELKILVSQSRTDCMIVP